MKISLLHAPLFNAGSSGDQPFLCWGERVLSYQKFREDVSQISIWLRESGCTRSARVAILLPKCAEFVQGIFATLYCGGTYIPLDIDSPVKRLRKVIDNANPALIISCEPFASNVFPEGDSRLRIVENPGSGHGLVDMAACDKDIDPTMPSLQLDDAAAILYTSGSTGIPKGVVLSHRNISSFSAWAVAKFSMQQSDRVISIAPFHFDLSTLDLFSTMASGARLFLPERESLRFPPLLTGHLEKEQISICYAAPTIWRLLESYGGVAQRNLQNLRLVIFAGEVYPIAELRRLMKSIPHAEYYNLYGPTETNVCTYYRVPEPPAENVTSIPIGAPCEFLEVTIRDGEGRQLGAHEKGEICVSGPSVMLGYHNRARDTQQSLVNEQARTYRTGDLGHFSRDGINIEFSGRKDFQVKIRGNRIELLEVESVLGAHAGVAAAVVVIKPVREGEMIVKAIVVPSAEGCEKSELIQHCRQFLPVVAVPGEIEFVKGFPVTSSGKIDRQKLNH
jgi:amino acid adenylation domain-containing protein